MKLLRNNLFALAIAISLAVSVVAFAAWGQGLDWQLERLSAYRLFPLFGLLAFSLMWSMYVVAAAQKYLKPDGKSLGKYFEVTGYFALAAILLHPGLLVIQLWLDGFGFPPGSYLQHYVAPSLGWAALLGTGAFAVFVAYEFRRILKNGKWKRWLSYASDIAILAILLHSLTLGSNLQSGWLRPVWFFYGAVLAVSLFYLRILPWLQKNNG
jgi:hypothetical protein